MDLKKTLRQYGESFVLAIFLAIGIKSYIISAYKIPTSSMSPTIKVGDFIFGNKWPYSFSSKISKMDDHKLLPQRGEVVIFQCPGSQNVNCVKRVIGLPGDKIELKGKRLYLNDRVAKYKKGQQLQAADVPGFGVKVILTETLGGNSYNILISDKENIGDYGPVVVPPGHVFVLGDNRDLSEDSRVWGSVPLSSVTARATFIWMSLDWREVEEAGGLPAIRWDRIFDTFTH